MKIKVLNSNADMQKFYQMQTFRFEFWESFFLTNRFQTEKILLFIIYIIFHNNIKVLTKETKTLN